MGLRNRVVGSSTGALLLLAVAFGATPAHSDTARVAGRAGVGPLVDVSKRAGNESETAVAIQQTNPNNITMLSNLESTGALWHAWSTDGGATWNTDLIADGDNLGAACCDPSLTSDEFGNIFMAWLSSSIRVRVAVSTNGGASFSSIASIALSGSSASGPTRALGLRLPVGDQPTVVAGEGEVWVTYESSNVIKANGAAVTGLGQVGAFGATQSVQNTNCNACDYADIAIGPDGHVMVAYQTPSGGEGPAALYSALDPDGLGPQGFQTPKLVTTTNVGGFDYIPAQSSRSVDAEVGLAWDRSGGALKGRLYFMWTSETPDESNNTNIMLKYSNDQGSTWSTPKKVNNDTGTSSQFNPKMALDETNGRLVVTWYDCRLDAGSGGAFDTNGVPNDDAAMVFAVTGNGGGSFTRSRLSKAASNDNDALNGIDYGDYEGLAYFGGHAYPAWADNSNTAGGNPNGTLHQFDIYTVSINI